MKFSVRKITDIQGSVLSSCEGRAAVYCAFKQSLMNIINEHIITEMGRQSDWSRRTLGDSQESPGWQSLLVEKYLI